LNSFAAQQRRGEFGWLAQDDKRLCFSELSWFLYVDAAQDAERRDEPLRRSQPQAKKDGTNVDLSVPGGQ
jgi:hypothetical protein